jgi:hypothetical protein
MVCRKLHTVKEFQSFHRFAREFVKFILEVREQLLRIIALLFPLVLCVIGMCLKCGLLTRQSFRELIGLLVQFLLSGTDLRLKGGLLICQSFPEFIVLCCQFVSSVLNVCLNPHLLIFNDSFHLSTSFTVSMEYCLNSSSRWLC